MQKNLCSCVNFRILCACLSGCSESSQPNAPASNSNNSYSSSTSDNNSSSSSESKSDETNDNSNSSTTTKKMQFQHVLIKYLMNALKQEKVFMFWEGWCLALGICLYLPAACIYHCKKYG